MEKQLKRGHLILQDNKRYGIITKELTSGTPIEAFINGKLVKGSIEYRFIDCEGQYYLLGDDDICYSLKNGIEVLFED